MKAIENPPVSVLEYLKSKRFSVNFDIEKNIKFLPEAYALNHSYEIIRSETTTL